MILKEIGEKSGKPVLLVIDDLDKVMDPALQQSLFIDRAMAWRRSRARLLRRCLSTRISESGSPRSTNCGPKCWSWTPSPSPHPMDRICRSPPFNHT